MILTKNSDVQLFVNGKMVDLTEDFDLNLNAKVFNPEDILTKTSDYSYTFSLPTTPRNNRILSYANVLSVTSKFTNTFDAELSVDGIEVFSGKLRISSIEKNKYKCNLVIIKVNTVEDIFSSTTLNLVDWKVPFSGIPTINSVNADNSSKYWFPLASYGVFAKNPVAKYNTYNDYTSIYDIDDTNKFYYSTFYPSVNVMELVRKCFETKGYSVDGTAFTDKYLNNLYMSTNLSSEQQPIYNLGNKLFGRCKLNVKFDNYYGRRDAREGTTTYYTQNGTLIDLDFPYNQYSKDDGYDFDEVFSYNMLETTRARQKGQNNRMSAYTWHSDVTVTDDTYMFSEDDGAITIPADGLYRIKLTVENLETIFNNSNMRNSASMKVKTHHTRDTWMQGEIYEDEVTVTKPSDGWEYRDWKPMEIQLVRNYDDHIELIKGTTSWFYNGAKCSRDGGTLIRTAYPHEDTRKGAATEKTDFMRYPTKKTDHSTPENNDSYYMPNEGEMFLYDPSVNPNFICGLSTMGNCTSFIKNGYSWYKGDTTSTDIRTNSNGYFKYEYDDSNVVSSVTRSEYHKMKYQNAPENRITLNAYDSSASGLVTGIVYLNKNDRLTLHIVTRAYENEVESGRWSTSTYPVSAQCQFEIEAVSKLHTSEYFDNGNDYNSVTEWESDLNLGNFLNNETTMADFVNDIIKSFNLSYIQDGKNITLDTQKISSNSSNRYAVNIDNRSGEGDTELKVERIEYPSSLQVEYNINTSEIGFYNSVPKDKINRDDWENYGDRGYSKIELDNTGDANDETVSLKSSYCWYGDFKIKKDGLITDVKIPIIAESQYYIDRGDIESYMTKDGFSLNYRFWFRTYDMADDFKTVYDFNDDVKTVDLYVPSNSYDGVELSYMANENNILENYFNLNQSIDSNYVEVQCHITAKEFSELKNGANAVFDSDLYRVVEISKFSVMRNNKATLKLMKI